jgi:hypothetical protein
MLIKVAKLERSWRGREQDAGLRGAGNFSQMTVVGDQCDKYNPGYGS